VRGQIERFLEYIARQNYAANTLLAYRADLEQLLEYLEPSDRDSWEQVTEEDIRGHLFLLWQREYASSTVVRKMAAIGSFFRFLVLQGTVRSDPTSEISLPQAARSSPEDVLSDEEVAQLLAHMAQDRTPKGHRDQVLLGLVAGAGFRPSELVALNLDDVEALSHQLSSQGHSRLRAVLERYVKEDRLGLAPVEEEPALFPSVGVGTGGGRLTRQGVWLIVKERAVASGLKRPVSPRSLRRTHLAHQHDQ
jgi:integrase/recombinase XerD